MTFSPPWSGCPMSLSAADPLASARSWRTGGRGDPRLGQQARAQTGGWQIRHRPVAATLDEFGVTFDRHDPAAWEIFREVTGWRGVLTAADALQQSLPAPLHVRGPLGVEESLNARVGDREYREEVALPPVGVR